MSVGQRWDLGLSLLEAEVTPEQRGRASKAEQSWIKVRDVRTDSG